MQERVQKIIASSGLCSRRKAEELIEEGHVKVNNVVVSLGDKADSQTDIILVNGKQIKIEEKKYYVLNKPKGYITTSDDMFNRKKVTDLVPRSPRVFSVGRLDRDATGILILTNDGDFAQNIAHPSKEVEKTYIAILDKPFSTFDIKKFKEGIRIEKDIVKAKVILLEKNTVAITLHVGIHKVVKRLFKMSGYYVRTLHRTHIGSLALDLDKGEWRELTEEDKKLIFTKPKITKATFLEN
ncbi:rRNA pseudouridine synthase [Candidatus Woesearchaeota archaeon]|nr:rRNA pseudouridine synthase [Candidatus Woesearchaeota archaeon]